MKKLKTKTMLPNAYCNLTFIGVIDVWQWQRKMKLKSDDYKYNNISVSKLKMKCI